MSSIIKTLYSYYDAEEKPDPKFLQLKKQIVNSEIQLEKVHKRINSHESRAEARLNSMENNLSFQSSKLNRLYEDLDDKVSKHFLSFDEQCNKLRNQVENIKFKQSTNIERIERLYKEDKNTTECLTNAIERVENVLNNLQEKNEQRFKTLSEDISDLKQQINIIMDSEGNRSKKYQTDEYKISNNRGLRPYHHKIH